VALGVAAAWFVAVLAALGALFAAGVHLPPRPASRRLAEAGVAVGAVAIVVLANVALFRHDGHLDLTRERAFTPSPEARRVILGLRQDVELVYFYQKQNPAGRAAKTMVEIMGRSNEHLRVRTVDPDLVPAEASRYGVRLYNVAVLSSGSQRVEVITTDDREIALGVLRVTRSAETVICFVSGHGEYDIDNFEFHTHFEGLHAHSHDVQGMAIVHTEQHGVGRLRRALDKLGFTSRKVALATAGAVPDDCAALVDANPRTLHTPGEATLIRTHLTRGRGALFLLEPDAPIEPRFAELLADAGVRVADGVVVDPLEHYFTDEQMVAITRYGAHAATRGLALAFFPGARPVEPVTAPAVRATTLFSSSASSYLRPAPGRADAPRAGTAAWSLAVAAEGHLPERLEGRPFRLVVVGDADFASNSFFPYMSNADLVLSLLAWLVGEERAPTLKPPVEVLPMVALTGRQVRSIFLTTVVGLPGAVVLIGGVVVWRRRR
jgi:hypothetical protein